jgi:hypothetical protein
LLHFSFRPIVIIDIQISYLFSSIFLSYIHEGTILSLIFTAVFSGGSSILCFNLKTFTSSLSLLTLYMMSSLSFSPGQNGFPLSASMSLLGLSFLFSKNCITSSLPSIICLAYSLLNLLRTLSASMRIISLLCIMARPCS